MSGAAGAVPISAPDRSAGKNTIALLCPVWFMLVGLFIPCYVDQVYPQVGMATMRVLEALGATTDFPPAQTCCGQPMANTGLSDATRPFAVRFFEIFKSYDYVVCPSGSCVSMVRNHYEAYLADEPGFHEFTGRVFELCEFITDVLKISSLPGKFAHKVGLHQSCHGLRELRLGSSTERNETQFSKVRQLLQSLEGIELVPLSRPDECCGFGGTFAVAEEAVSCLMGADRIDDHLSAGADIMVGNDMSCLMHLDGMIRRRGKPLRTLHIAEILAEVLGVGPAFDAELHRPIEKQPNLVSIATPNQTT